MIKDILKQWNLDCEPVQIYHSAWEAEERYVLKEYEDMENVKRNIIIFEALSNSELPVPFVIPCANGEKVYEQDDKYYLLTAKLKGKNIVDINKYDANWFFDFGVILAKLHLAFLECEKNIDCWYNSLLEEMTGWVCDNLKKYKPEYLSESDVKDVINELDNVYDKLPKQLIHRDVHLGNFLFDEGKFSGYIDFDLSQSNIRIFDLCYFLLGLLLEEDNNRVEIEKWYFIVGQVIKGYDSKIQLCDVEKESITCVMKNIELLFVAYFLGIGDEKSAKDSADLFELVRKNESKIKDKIW